MKYHNKKLTTVAMFMLCILFLGCSQNEIPTSTVVEPGTILTKQISTSTNKPYTPTSTFTKTLPSSTPTSTRTDVPPTSTATITPPPTFTPGPTIAPELVQDFLMDLYQNNAGCQLPCWWGFTPGSTRWQEVEAFYQRFGAPLTLNDVAYSKLGVKIYSTKHTFDNSEIRLHEYISVKDEIIETIIIGGNTVRNDKEIEGDPYYLQILRNYRLSSLLTTYGVPDGIWLRTFPGAPEGGGIPYYLIVEFNQLGIAAKYSGHVVNNGSTFQICPQRVNIRLMLWSADKSDQTTVEQARDLNFVTNSDFRKYKPLQSASDMTVEEFYNEFKNPGNQSCISTDPNDWDF